jgi:hypothetical protein
MCRTDANQIANPAFQNNAVIIQQLMGKLGVRLFLNLKSVSI